MKRTLCIILTMLFCVGFAACEKDTSDSSSSSNQGQSSVQSGIELPEDKFD